MKDVLVTEYSTVPLGTQAAYRENVCTRGWHFNFLLAIMHDVTHGQVAGRGQRGMNSRPASPPCTIETSLPGLSQPRCPQATALHHESFGWHRLAEHEGENQTPQSCALTDTSPAVLWVASMSCDNNSPSSVPQESRCCLPDNNCPSSPRFLAGFFLMMLLKIAGSWWEAPPVPLVWVLLPGPQHLASPSLCCDCDSISQGPPPTAQVAPDPSCVTTPPPPGGLSPLGTGVGFQGGTGLKYTCNILHNNNNKTEVTVETI